ncbi:MAG: hypothetical protein AB7D57_08110 [Desulfovibrionaceae bacterium]
MPRHALRLTLGCILGLVLMSAACATRSTESTGQTSVENSGEPSVEQYEEVNFYYEFKDILVPKELTPADDAKYVFDDERFLAGFRVFKGRVVAEDLFQFFATNMKKDGWKVRFTLKSDRSVLSFQKPNKSCTILIEDGFNTKVTIFAIEFRSPSGSMGSSSGADVQVQDLPQ